MIEKIEEAFRLVSIKYSVPETAKKVLNSFKKDIKSLKFEKSSHIT